MKYFLVNQDETQKNIPKLINWYKKIDKHSIDNREYENIPFRTIIKVAHNDNLNFIDIILKPFFLVSIDFKNLINLFEPNMQFKEIFLQDKDNGETKQYFLPVLDVFDCLDEETTFNLDKSIIKHGIINEEKLKDKAIFAIDNITSQQVVIRMDLAEAMFRRNYTGATFIELDKKEIDK